MALLLNVVYLLLLAALSPWLLYAAIRKGKYTRGLSDRFFGTAPRRAPGQNTIWLHAVSVGEVNLLETLLQEIDDCIPDSECVISTTTRTGFELAQKKYSSRTIFYAPLDFSWAVRRTLDRLHPKMLILAETELWPNLLHYSHRRGLPVAIINGRLSEKSAHGYRRLGPLMRRLLQKMSLLAVQSDQYAERFIQLGADPQTVHVTGSIKFDGAATDRSNAQTKELRQLAAVDAHTTVLLAGSTQQSEEEMILASYRRLKVDHKNLRLIIVPRHRERFDAVAGMITREGHRLVRRSQLEVDSVVDPSAVLLVDIIGELGAWWGMADIGLVGGCFGKRGGQNMIEPSAYGVATCFGPDTRNFRDIVQLLLAKEAAVVIRDGQQLHDFIQKCLTDRAYARALGVRARELVIEQQGATGRTTSLLRDLLQKPTE